MSADVGEMLILSETTIRTRLSLGRGFAGKEDSDDGSRFVIGCRITTGFGWLEAAREKACTSAPKTR